MAKQNVTSDMFEPRMLQETVDALEPSRGLKLYNMVPKDQTTYPYVQWTIRRGTISDLAEYNSPNSAANKVDKQPGNTERQATLAYMREGDRFTPTTTMLLKDIEAGIENAVVPAEKQIAESLAYVSNRIDGRIEWSLWQAIQGELNYSGKNTGPLSVDYGFRDSHKATAANLWDQSAGSVSIFTMIEDIRVMKSLVERDGGVPVENVYLSRPTFELLIKAWTDSAVEDAHRRLLTDTQLNEFFATGKITGFMGTSSWEAVDQFYDVRGEDGQTVESRSYIPHGTVLFNNLSAGRPLKYTQGPSMDFNAPRGHVGRFVHSWIDPDPSGRQFIIEEHGLPVLTRPDQFASLKVAGDEWINAQGWQ